MTWMQWYDSLWKPSWTPAPATIGLIWQILYPIIIVTFGVVFVQASRRKMPWMVALPFVINLVANMIFTPIQFGMRNLPLAAVDILIVWTTIIWMMLVIWKHHKWVAVAQIAEWVGADVVNIHGGGAYGDKRKALADFARNLKQLSRRARRRLTVENDDTTYTKKHSSSP